MYELNRVRLVNIGPPGARYDDVTIDLSSAGELAGASDLFTEGTRRPAAAALLMLENGGGKSVLLKLVFSVVLPGRRRTVGGTALDDYVLDGDTGHVVLEWMHAATGVLLLTGKVAQRRTRTVANSNPLAEGWYLLRPSTNVDLEHLPLLAEGRRHRLEGYRTALAEAQREDPSLELSWRAGDEQAAWTADLAQVKLDSDLFDLQRRMNLDEGDAAEAFAFTSAQGFVDWLLRTVTAKADLASMAGMFAEYATNLRDRDAMMAERDFLEGAVAGLEPLADAHEATATAQYEARSSARYAHTLLRALTARLQAEEELADALEARAKADAGTVTTLSTSRDNARALSNQVRLQTLLLSQARVESEQGEHELATKAAENVVAGWAQVPLVYRVATLEASARALRAQVEAADAEASPALARRDHAAGLLLARLDHEAQQADDEARRLDTEAAEHTATAHVWAARLSSATASLAQLGTRKDAATSALSEATAALGDAVAYGHLAAGTPLAHVQASIERAATAHEGAVRQLALARDRAGQARSDLGAADSELGAAQASLRTAESAWSSAADRLAAAEHEARIIGEAPAIQHAAGDDQPLEAHALDSMVERLTQVLDADILAHQEARAPLTSEMGTLDRQLASLGDGGLLPARDDVDRVVNALAAAQVSAWPGWRYLAETAPTASRSALIEAHPELADGVVLADPATLHDARHLLDAAQLLPSAAVTVGLGADLLVPATSPASRFVVDPNPGLYDVEAAADRRVELAQRRKALGAHAAELTDAEERDRGALSDLSAWRRAHPVGHLSELAANAGAIRVKAGEAREAAEMAKQSALLAQDADDRAQMELDEAITAERRASDAVGGLKVVAAAAARAADRTRDADAAEPAMLEARAAAEQAEGEGREATAQATACAVEAERARNRAATHRTAATAVPSTAGERSLSVPSESLGDLAVEARATHEAYLAMRAPDDLRREAELAADEHRRVAGDLARAESGHVAAARELLASPAGGDPGLWESGTRVARIHLAKLRERDIGLAGELATVQTQVKGARPAGGGSWAVLDEQWRPADEQAGAHLTRRAERALADAQHTLDDAQSALETLRLGITEAKAAVTAFTKAKGPLDGALRALSDPGTHVVAEPYAYGGAQAAADQEAAIADLRATTDRATQAEASERAALADLVAFASDPRFERVESPARLVILRSGGDQVTASSRTWAVQMTARLESLRSDLEAAERHRHLLVERLAALVDQGLRTLKHAQRLSELPEDLGDWGRRPFVQIRFKAPDLPTIASYVARVVDEAASRTGDSARRDGMGLLLDGVHAAVPGGFDVTVLKPDSVLRDQRVPVADMAKVFSGGQELTAAIVLYCTLAALRASERGHLRAKHSGVLFLDNPIGKASATYLLTLQQAVARALGVQLVYTTGLSDDQVLAQFPLWVRLINQADIRAHYKHITVAQTHRAHLPGPPGPEGHLGTLAATRVYRRQPAPT